MCCTHHWIHEEFMNEKCFNLKFDGPINKHYLPLVLLPKLPNLSRSIIWVCTYLSDDDLESFSFEPCAPIIYFYSLNLFYSTYHFISSVFLVCGNVSIKSNVSMHQFIGRKDKDFKKWFPKDDRDF